VLLQGFAGELIDGVGQEDVAASLRAAISAWLDARFSDQAAPLPVTMGG
jgi:hypothetical protein